MGEPERSDSSASTNHSLDDIINHMNADLHSYEERRYILQTQHVWPDYGASANQPMTVHNPMYVPQPYDRTIHDFSSQRMYLPPRVHERSGDMIGMVNVGGGSFLNVVFNPSNSGAPVHPYIPAPHPDPSISFIHYAQHASQTHVPQGSVHQDYGLFNSENELTTNKNNQQLIEHVAGNFMPNKSGTYSQFGGLSISQTDTLNDSRTLRPQKKPRIVAEVKPMRLSYSDVLAKSPPPLTPPLTAKQPSSQPSGKIMRCEGKKQNSKTLKSTGVNPISKTINPVPIKRPSSNNNEDFIKARQSITYDDLTPPQSSEENWFLDYDSYADENIGTGDGFALPSAVGGIKKEKKQKKRLSFTDDKCEALNNHKVGGATNGGYGKRPLHINNNLQSKVPLTEKNFTKSASKNAKSLDETKKVSAPSLFGTGAANKANVNSYEEKGPSVSRVSRNVSSTTTTSSSHKRCQRSTKRRDGQSYISVLCKRWQQQMSRYGFMFLTWFFHLIWDILALSARLSLHLFAAMWEMGLVWIAWLRNKITKVFGRDPWWYRWGKRSLPSKNSLESPGSGGLKSNISLPATGDEAMKRLLACKGKDPYSILGVTNQCTDDDIKKYYKKQAVLVHPDKNSQPGAEEAFKILVHAFELIGEPERRSAYDRCVVETHQVEQAWSELSELLTQLHHKMEYAANTIRCTNCGKRHKRVIMQRPCYAARFCAQCKIHHSAREGDIWAESWMLGLLWRYYACMEGAVYDITEWAACQADNLKHLNANSHAVQYRIVLGKQNHHLHKDNYNEPDLEEFLNTLYAQTGKPSADTASGGCDGSTYQRKKGKKRSKI